MTRFRQAGFAVLLAFLAVSQLQARPVRLNTLSPAGRVDPTGSMTVARAAHTATLLPSGKVLIAGGMVGNGSFLASVELYEPSTGTFSATASMHTARVGHQAVLLPDGRVLVIGGGRAANRTLAEIYDESRAQWQDAGSIPGDFMALLNDGTVLISGARDSAPGFRSTDTYDPTTGIITPAGRMSATLYGPATLLRDGRVLVAGGEDDTKMVGDAVLYNPATRAWTSTGQLQTPRDKHAATRLPDGRVLITGGSDRTGWRGQMNTTEIYDPASGVFAAGPSMRSPRFKLQGSVTALPTGEILVAGGSTEVEIYDPLSGRFGVASGSLDEPRFFSSATTLRDGRVLIAGGYNQGSIASTEKAWLHKR